MLDGEIRTDREWMLDEDWQTAEHSSQVLLDKSADETAKVDAVKKIAALSNKPVNKPVLWKVEVVAEALTSAVSSSSSDAVQFHAMRALAALANLPANQGPIMENTTCFDSIVAAASSSCTSNELRMWALRCLAYICQMPFNQKPVWDHEKARAAIIAAAQETSPQNMRESGLMALCSLTVAAGTCNSTSISEPIWYNEDCRKAIIAAATDKESTNQEKGIWALSNLSYTEELFAPMLKDASVGTALEVCLKDKSDKEAYVYKTAMGALHRLKGQDIHAAL